MKSDGSRMVFDVTRKDTSTPGKTFWKKVGIAFLSEQTSGPNRGKLTGTLVLNMFDEKYSLFEKTDEAAKSARDEEAVMDGPDPTDPKFGY